jgi:E3 ubiquitin-protein ligase UBR4
VLHALEEMRTTDAEKVGLLAEKILDNVNDSERAKAEIDSVRRASREEKQKIALRKRQEILAKMGLKQAAGGKITAGAMPGSIETIEDERGVKCMVCQEGYTLKPKDVLGFYTWMRPTALHSFAATRAAGSIPSPSRSDSGVSTVTHFNVIHVRCHEDATKGERKKKQPLDEWEAAALRNHNTRCNNVFPLGGPEVTDDGITAALERYWQLVNNVRRTDVPRLRLLIHDLKFALMRFCYIEGTLAAPQPTHQQTPAGGPIVTEGGRESNLRMCAFMVHVALFISTSTSQTTRGPSKGTPFDPDRSLSQFLAADKDTWIASASQSDNVPFHLALSLLCMTPIQWRTFKPAFLQRLIAYSFVESTACKSALAASSASASTSTTPSSSMQTIFEACRPSLMMMSLVDRLHRVLKAGVADQPACDAAWQRMLMQHMARESGPIGDKIAGVLKAIDEEIVQFADFAEFADDLQVLDIILKESGSVETFVTELWQSF